MPVSVPWVQTFLYCVAPPALRLGSVLPMFWLLLLRFVRVTRIPYGQTGRCSYVAVLVDGTLLTDVLLFYG